MKWKLCFVFVLVHIEYGTLQSHSPMTPAKGDNKDLAEGEDKNYPSRLKELTISRRQAVNDYDEIYDDDYGGQGARPKVRAPPANPGQPYQWRFGGNVRTGQAIRGQNERNEPTAQRVEEWARRNGAEEWARRMELSQQDKERKEMYRNFESMGLRLPPPYERPAIPAEPVVRQKPVSGQRPVSIQKPVATGGNGGNPWQLAASGGNGGNGGSGWKRWQSRNPITPQNQNLPNPISTRNCPKCGLQHNAQKATVNWPQQPLRSRSLPTIHERSQELRPNWQQPNWQQIPQSPNRKPGCPQLGKLSCGPNRTQSTARALLATSKTRLRPTIPNTLVNWQNAPQISNPNYARFLARSRSAPSRLAPSWPRSSNRRKRLQRKNQN